jgi:hypothetical protein
MEAENMDIYTFYTVVHLLASKKTNLQKTPAK